MSENAHNPEPGGTYFFTIRLADPGSDLLILKISDLRHAMREIKQRHPFHIDAITVLPSVIHTIWTLQDGATDYPNRIGMLKSKFSRRQPMPPHRPPTQIKRGEKAIWQRRTWEHQIQDTADLTRHRNLVYHSPVHAGLCATPQDWPHTSLHRDLASGRQPATGIFHGAARLPLAPPTRANRYQDNFQRAI